MEPIRNFLSGDRLKVAELQDYIVDIIYEKIDPRAELYGGTAIWRCYGGNRFSEDIDIYMKRESTEKLISSLPKYGMRITWRDKEIPTNIRISDGVTELLLESKDGSAESIIRQYMRVDGSSLTISVLGPTELLVRKIEAYEGRGLIRDLYDIFVLTNHIDRRDYTVSEKLSSFLETVRRPSDEKMLSSLIYSGNNTLSYREITGYLRRWLNEV